jgi:hypothetical protein
MSTITYEDIANSFKTIIVNDPMITELNNKYSSWYDVCMKYDPTFYHIENKRLANLYASCDKEDDCVTVCDDVSNTSFSSDSDDDNFMYAFAHVKTTVAAPKKEVPVKNDIRPVDVTDNGIKTIVLRNLPRFLTKEKLSDKIHDVLNKYGDITDVYIPINPDRSSQYYGTIKGFAMVTFLHSRDACYAHFNETGQLTINGVSILIDFAYGDRKKPQEMAAKYHSKKWV